MQSASAGFEKMQRESSPSVQAELPLRPRLRRLLGWTRASYSLMSAFLAVILLILIVWWPLVEEYASYFDPRYPLWMQIDWLLIGIFAAMSLLIMAGADFKRDAWIVMVGMCGGLVIEGWGTQTLLWSYYTNERPPLWIIPAWPVASLAIDRLMRILRLLAEKLPKRVDAALYWPVFGLFYLYMLYFVWPTLDKSLTILALLSCALLVLSPADRRTALLTFLAGTGLGYFLERWGTTRECWTYYTRETPPFFAVLAHGLAAVAFWRVGVMGKRYIKRVFPLLFIRRQKEKKSA